MEILGPVRAWQGGQELALGPPRQRAVLAALAARANRVVTRDELIDALWSGDPPASAVNRVHSHVSGLRRVLEPDRRRRTAGQVLTSAGSGYRLTLPPHRLDLRCFDEHLDRARRLAAAGDLAGVADALDRALELWHGTPLAGIPGPWAEAERTRVAELRFKAIEDRADAKLRLGRHVELVAELSALVLEHPLRERLRALLMLALYRSGRQADALTVYADSRRLLIEELGTEPGPELRQVQQDILVAQRAGQGGPAGGPGRPDGPSRAGPGWPDGSPGAGRDAAGPVPTPAPRQLPAAVRHFTGRTAELGALSALLAEPAEATGSVLVAAIVGAPGVGKTALAVHWAHQVAGEFPDGHLYVDLRGYDRNGAPVRPGEAVRGFLDALGVPPERIPPSVAGQAALYRGLLAGRRVLVVLDNARDAGQVRPLLSGAAGCLFVVTSRDQLTSLAAVEGVQPVTLNVLSTPEASQLLARRTGAGRVAAGPAAVAEIVRRCAGLPLALTIVATRAVARPEFPLAAIAAELGSARLSLDGFAAGDPAIDVRAAFSWSYQTLSAATARLFRLLSLHPGPDISASAAASLAGAPTEEVLPLLAELARAHLLTEPAPGRYAFHDLLRAYAAEQARAQDRPADRQAAVCRVLDHYLHTAYAADRLLNPGRDPVTPAPPAPGTRPEPLADPAGALAWFHAEHAVLLAAVDQAAGAGLDRLCWQLAWNLATFLDYRGHWPDAVATQCAALAAAVRGRDRAGQAHAHRLLARAYARLGRHDDVRGHLRQALELSGVLGDRAGRAHTHLYLAQLCEQQGRHRDLLHHAERALELFRAAGHQPGRATALNAIGWAYTLLGEDQQALAYCHDALPLHRAHGDRPGEAATWDTLGRAYRQLGHARRAVTCYRRAVDLCRGLGDRYHEAGTLVQLGDAYGLAGQVDEAHAAWRLALGILDDLDHLDAGRVRARLDRAGPARPPPPPARWAAGAHAGRPVPG